VISTIGERSGVDTADLEKGRGPAGAQTLVRGLEIIDAASRGSIGPTELGEALGLTRSTAHRLASTLVEHGYLRFARGSGYTLGPRLLELGYLASRQTTLPQVARGHIEQLSAVTGDTVHLGVLEGNQALYLDKIPGTRRVEISSRIGERQPLRSTGLGKALILDAEEAQWRAYYDHEARLGCAYGVDLALWLGRMRDYAQHGYAFDLEENEDRIRCVAAPVRDVSGSIVGAISLSSASQYMDDKRMQELTFDVKRTAGNISRDLGYDPKAAPHKTPATSRRSRAASS